MKYQQQNNLKIVVVFIICRKIQKLNLLLKKIVSTYRFSIFLNFWKENLKDLVINFQALILENKNYINID